MLPPQLTSFGVGSDKLGDMFHIYFLSAHTAKKLYLGEDVLTEDLSEALQTDDMKFIVEELGNLLSDDVFMEYLAGELCPF